MRSSSTRPPPTGPAPAPAPSGQNMSPSSTVKEINIVAANGYVFSTDTVFFAGGPTHRLEIDFKDCLMKLLIDGVLKHTEEQLGWHFRGTVAFSVDGKVVDFVWDLYNLRAVTFTFRTRAGDGAAACRWEEQEEIHKLTIHGSNLYR
ncbi:hypothetical protein KSP40_PGU005508 [Platanthera guangdongensis]|uniref:Uncharacterized protein n=1 Tax=Platanthera guangdongensis TaxID=2320717 RepID=A0ABR2MBE1_9ASPA